MVYSIYPFILETISSLQSVSIVIPTWNEEGNIRTLVEEIHRALSAASITYEIIFIDDYSTDQTLSEIYILMDKYPVSVHLKKLQKGKSQSLIEGFSYANYPVICMIDADLQYSPLAIPAMVTKVYEGESDIVIANRIHHRTKKIRKLMSQTFRRLFIKGLHGLPYDVQSGLKVFRKEIVERISINPSPWTFDLDFLLSATNAGYTITSHDIRFRNRFSGNSKIGVLQSSVQIGREAIKAKFRSPKAVALHKNDIKQHGHGFHYKGKKYMTYSTLEHSATALYTMTNEHKRFLFIAALLLITALVINWQLLLITFFSILTILYFFDLLFNLYLIFRSFVKTPEVKISKAAIAQRNQYEWPSYTIFCPLYKEWQVIPQFVEAMNKLDYPMEKLQIMLLLEEDDVETIKHVYNYNLPNNFQTIVVPHSFPKTKPKACNYGLRFATGKYSVIYDAEDAPEATQLKKTVIAFEKLSPQTMCIQAKLNFYNPHQNLLTRLFTLEYSLWFDLVLTGLQSINAPIPLGGTSNHFRTQDLHNLQGWDAFNVTEDCDLGIRLAKKGFKTAIIDSTTLEEANSNAFNWYRQRTRWIKGYMQTYLVHMRNIRPSNIEGGLLQLVTFQLTVGGKILSLLINPMMWIITIAYFTFRAVLGSYIEKLFPGVIMYIGVFSLVLGNFLYMYYYMIGCAKRKQFELIKFALFVPLYWLGMSIAALGALKSIIINPHYWAKTTHGLHLRKTEEVEEKPLITQQFTPTLSI